MNSGFRLLPRSLSPPPKLDHLDLKYTFEKWAVIVLLVILPLVVVPRVVVPPVVVPQMKLTHTQLMLTQLQSETNPQIMKLKNY